MVGVKQSITNPGRPEVRSALTSGVTVIYLIVTLVGLFALLALLLTAFHATRPQALRVAVRLARLLHVELEVTARDDHGIQRGSCPPPLATPLPEASSPASAIEQSKEPATS
jgi:hypothetical protein